MEYVTNFRMQIINKKPRTQRIECGVIMCKRWLYLRVKSFGFLLPIVIVACLSADRLVTKELIINTKVKKKISCSKIFNKFLLCCHGIIV